MSRAVAEDSPAKIACYPILGRISFGGQGTVYQARDPHTGGDIAIKVLSEQMANDPVLRLRFAQECQVTRALRHPHIVRVLDFGLDGNKPYLVMEYVEGESLGQRLDREGRLSEHEAVALIGQIGEALQWAHQRGLIHRDVTPDNILVTADGGAKLSDLGLVKNVAGDFDLTRSQSSLGTPNFMAPEQFEDAKRADALSDLYSLAATLYMALTGELPFRAKHGFALGAIYKKKLTNDIAGPRQLVPEISAGVDAAIRRALRGNRSERQASVAEFLASLTEPPPVEIEVSLAESEPIQAEADQQPERRRAPRLPTRIGAACRPLERDAAAVWRGVVVNLSDSGLCLELGRKFEPGALLAIRMGGQKLRRQSLLVRVMWVKKRSAQSWQIGCQYDQPLSEQEVKDLA